MGTLLLISGLTSFCFYPWLYRVTTPQELVSRGLCIFLAAILQYNKGSTKRSTLSLVNWNLGVGGPTQSISTALGPYAMTLSQISSRPAWPNSINKYFITWPLLGFLRQRKLSQTTFRGAPCDPSRAVRLFPALLALSRTALIRGFCKWFAIESARGAVRVVR